MNKHGNLKKDEVIGAAIAACAAGIASMAAWYFIAEDANDLETDDLFMSQDEDVYLDDINEGMEASSKKFRPASSAHSKHHVNKPHSTNRIAETMSAMAANLCKIAKVLDQSDTISIDDLYEGVMKIEGFDDEFLIEAFEYVCSDDRKARTFLSLNDRQRKIWLLKHLRTLNG